MNPTRTLAVSIVLALVADAAVAAEPQPAPTQFVTPFAVKDGVIRDANGREVRLWGVNYYAPFSHNYLNIAEVGADHRAAIAEDVAQFRLMGVDFVRIHVFDREISDAQGHLTPNRHLEVFDELLEALDRAGIYVMLTTIAWWNTPENQSLMDRYYAFWHVGAGGSFGFSNFFGSDEMVWNEDAIRCQERYVAELLEHRSSISNRRYADFPNLVAIEPINEPSYVRPNLLREMPDSKKPTTQYSARSSHGAARERLHKLWHDFQASHPGDETTQFEKFRAELLQRYLDRMFAAIDGAMKRPYLRAHIDYSLGDPRIHEVLNNVELDAYTCACYPKDHMGFESTWRDHCDFFELIRQWNTKILAQKTDDRPRIVYEFNAPSTLQGYPYGAMAVAFAARRAQMAAMFTYTPTAVAEYNPGWRIHYLNLLHTPARAAAFAAAGQIFRRVAVDTPIPTNSTQWSGSGWSIRNKPDAVAFAADDLLVHSGRLIQGRHAKLGTHHDPGQRLLPVRYGRGQRHLSCRTNITWKLECDRLPERATRERSLSRAIVSAHGQPLHQRQRVARHLALAATTTPLRIPPGQCGLPEVHTMRRRRRIADSRRARWLVFPHPRQVQRGSSRPAIQMIPTNSEMVEPGCKCL